MAASRSLDDELAAEMDRRAASDARIAEIRAIKSALEKPEMRAMIASQLGIASSAPAERRREARKDTPATKTGLERVRRFFASRGNAGATIKEIAAGADVSHSNTRRLIYESSAEHFEKCGTNDATREKLFRLHETNAESA